MQNSGRKLKHAPKYITADIHARITTLVQWFAHITLYNEISNEKLNKAVEIRAKIPFEMLE